MRTGTRDDAAEVRVEYGRMEWALLCESLHSVVQEVVPWRRQFPMVVEHPRLMMLAATLLSSRLCAIGRI